MRVRRLARQHVTHRTRSLRPALALATLALAVLALLLATACGGDAADSPESAVTPPPTPSPTADPLALATPAPAETPSPTPAATPTQAAAPEPTPSPAATPNPDGSTECVLDPNFGPVTWQMEDFFKWTPDGSRLLFNARRGAVGIALFAAGADGTFVEEIVYTTPEDDFWDLIGPMVYFDASPDGAHLVYSTCQYPEDSGPKKSTYNRAEYDYELVLSNIDGSEVTRLTENDFLDNFPVWSPDGKRIAYLASRQEAESGRLTRLNVLSLDTGEQTTYGDVQLEFHPPVWSPDSRHVAVIAWEPEYGADGYVRRPSYVHVIDTVDSSEVRISETLSRPSWSPDGLRVALIAPEGNDEAALYTFALDGGDPFRVAGLGFVQDIVPAHSLDDYGIYLQFGRSPSNWVGNVYWSPDGSTILLDGHIARYAVDGSGVTNYLQLDKSKRRERPAETSKNLLAPFMRAAWSPDGSRIAVQTIPELDDYYPDNDIYLYTMNPDGTEPRVLLRLVRAEDDRRRITFVTIPPPPQANPGSCSDGTAVPEPESNPGLVEDCRTLLGIRNTLAGSDALDWTSDTPIDDWTGVELGGSPPRVHGLDYDGKGGSLYGWIPVEIANLTELRTLSLRNTSVNGPIPPALGDLSNLESLVLTWNQLKGPIPTALGSLPNLGELKLLFNKLTGCIPLSLQDRDFDTDLDSLGLPYCE